MAIVGRTAADVRDVMVEGASGILAVHPLNERPVYHPTKRRLVWPNGAIATTYSASEPDVLRGPQHDKGWVDELAAWEYEAAFSNLRFGLRIGRPQVVVTTTPRPRPWIRRLMTEGSTKVITGSTFDNRSNLAPQFFEEIVKRYDGTRLGRQELYAEMLDQAEGALWTREMLEECRIAVTSVPMKRIVVAIDPAVTSSEQSDETGIVIAGLGNDNNGYLLADLSGRFSPEGWAKAALGAYHSWKAHRIVGETNNGGDMIEQIIRMMPGGQTVPYRKIHATRDSKAARAEPIAALYEQKRIKHVGLFVELEDQLATWEPYGDLGSGEKSSNRKFKSPDRLDALVWAFTELMLTNMPDLSKIQIFSHTEPSYWRRQMT
jgi:phage terminase large subunit-like protein